MLDITDPVVQKTCYIILETFISGAAPTRRALILEILMAAADYVLAAAQEP